VSASAPTVVGLYRCATGGAAMESLSTLRAIEGYGVEGDRYADGAGYWSFKREYVDDITFVESEVLERVAAELGRCFGAIDSRRNVATAGIRLDALVGRRFHIDDVLFEGLRPCDPCRYLDGLTGLPVRALLVGCGGLRARIVETGEIAVGSTIVVAPAIPLSR
jgi:hypothetical protein